MIKAEQVPWVVGAVALAAVGLYVWKRGGVTQAAAGAGAAVVNAAGGAASGAVGAVGAAVGLPTPDDTTTDPGVARWLIDRAGYFEASKWAGAVALARAAMMDKGSGTPPPAGSPIARAFPVAPAASDGPAGQGSSASSYTNGFDYTGRESFDQLSKPDGWWPYGPGWYASPGAAP